MFCRNCRESVDENDELCDYCGKNPMHATKFCFACGTHTRSNDTICNRCGVDLPTWDGMPKAKSRRSDSRVLILAGLSVVVLFVLIVLFVLT